MTKTVSLTIDNQPVTVPEGTLVVDAAKKVGVYIPVFCYHPKMEPVGMCRMCLVEVGRPVIDRATGQVVREADGAPKIQFGPKMETACTLPVSEGMVVRGFIENVSRARKDVLEFLLTSHPLDCPVCDKGGECPLQNLTMDFGPSQSRFLYDEKMHLAKRQPLGELIWLDRERCIQCARCVRFQEDIAGDPVIGFYQRGRTLQIVTHSEPGFDSYFSGNTTDICPVGALTTADFRFGARPWELSHAASICQQCPVGCNLTLDTRREHKSGGDMAIKRVMPRQNECVNEIWICDKGRFAYHYAQSKERLTQPLIRKNGELIPASWEEALKLVAAQFQAAGEGLLTLASGRLSNEDLFNLGELTAHLGGRTALDTHMAGGDLVAQVGVGAGTNFSEMGAETAILVVACDLLEEAPLYYLRVKQAAERGAKLIVANPRPTRLDRYAMHVVRYPYGAEAEQIANLPTEAKALMEGRNLIIVFGSEGASLQSSGALAQACASLLVKGGHAGKPNNGLIGVWPRANEQGAWDMGFRPLDDLAQAMQQTSALYIVASDPFGDQPSLLAQRPASFLVVQELFLTETAKQADVVLPALPFTEREGTLTNAERRVQRYYPAVPARAHARADFAITAEIGKSLGVALESETASQVMARIAARLPDYAGLTYLKLAEVAPQWPLIGREDLYYGGTSYQNQQGLGVQLSLTVVQDRTEPERLPKAAGLQGNGLWAVPVSRLYDRGQTVMPSELLHPRIPQPYVVLHPTTAATLGITESVVRLHLNGEVFEVTARLDENAPQGVALLPRSMGVPISRPTPAVIEVAR